MRYVYNKQAIYTGQALDLTLYDPFPVLSTEVAPPSLNDGEYARFLGDSWEVITELPEKPKRVPQSVAMSSFQLAMLEIGELDNVQPVIDALPMPDKRKAQILWDKANFVERSNPFVATLGAVMGKTEAEIDDLFILAETL